MAQVSPEPDDRRQLRRAIIASTVGTTIEWYDFFLYSTVTGLVFGPLYFPKSDSVVGTLQAFGIYAVGFVARPVGAAVFGHYGDRIGRKSALIATLLLMGISTFLVAFVPPYEKIGLWGAVLLVILRFVQGVGVGGEWGGSVLMSMEWTKTNAHRGFVASWPQFGVPAGLFLANLAVLAFSRISGTHFLTWGWRIPFLLSILLVGIGLYIRLYSGDAGLLAPGIGKKDRAHTGPRGAQAAAAANPLVGRRSHGRAGAVLHLHGIRVHLWDQSPAGLA
jgi:MFS family permease